MRDGVWTSMLKNPGSIVSRRLAKGAVRTADMSSDTMESICPTSRAYASIDIIDMLCPFCVTGIMGFIGLIYHKWQSRTLIPVVEGNSANLGHHVVKKKCVDHIAATDAAQDQSLHEISRRLDDQHEFLEKIHLLLASSQSVRGQKNTDQHQPCEEVCLGVQQADWSMNPYTTTDSIRL